MTRQEKIDKYTQAIEEAQRFINKSQAAIVRLLNDQYAQYGCKETASAKRASLDLSRVLAELRR